jgi:transcription elongation factor SPT5
VKPTLIELEIFEDVPEGVNIELTLSNKDNLMNSQTLCSGDNVEVCAGELINLQGKVLSIDGDTVLIMPIHDNLNVSNIFNRY